MKKTCWIINAPEITFNFQKLISAGIKYLPEGFYFEFDWINKIREIHYKMENDPSRITQLNRLTRKAWGLFFTAITMILLAGAVSVPFIFESQTLRYQFGMSRTLLLTGQVMGTLAGTQLLIQLILIGRFRFLDRIFSINRLLLLHSVNAVIIAVLAFSHFLLILITLTAEILEPATSQWPEFTGLLLLITLTGTVLSGLFRNPIGLSYKFWWILHRVFTPLAILMLCVHVYFVSETFNYGNARILILCFAGACFFFYMWARLRKLAIFRCLYRVINVRAAANNIYEVDLIPEKKRRIINMPGQFAFLKFKSPAVSGEEHPFTVSSSPTRPPVLQFTIRESGDWTNNVKNLSRGDMAFISGAYGIFGHIDPDSSREMTMIAGGIGITPMLSILRYLSDVKSTRKITLLWSNRSKNEVVYPDEFKRLEQELPGLDIKFLFTREAAQTGKTMRFNINKLKDLTAGCSRDSIVLLCGPPGMMSGVKKDLVTLGFPVKSIISERFVL